MISEKIHKEIMKRIKKASFDKNPCFYLYDLGNITSKLGLLQKNMPHNVKMFYSLKANPHQRIIKHMSSHPFIKGVEISSIGDLHKALKVYKPLDIIFVSPGKTLFEIRSALQKKIGLIVVESRLEAIRIQQIAEQEKIPFVNVLLRINIDFKAPLTLKYESVATQLASGISSKQGIDESIILTTFKEISSLDRIAVKGIHVMAGGEELDYKNLLTYFHYVFLLTKRIEERGFKVNIIDFGGGWGIDYESKGRKIDVKTLGKEMDSMIKKFNYGEKVLIFELGKYLVGESGYYVTEIIDIKESMGKKQIITSGGINHLKRPQEARMNHPTSIITLGKPVLYPQQISVIQEKVDIGGPLCTSLDTYCQDILIKNANVGDLVVVQLLGAYGLTFSPVHFLGHPLPKEYFIK